MMPSQLRCIFAATVSMVAITVGCSEGELMARPDTGLSPDAGEKIDGGQRDGRSATHADSDTGPKDPDPGPPAVESFVNCGAGGVSTGNEIRAVQCYGPTDLAGREASGEAIRWQPGAFRVVTD